MRRREYGGCTHLENIAGGDNEFLGERQELANDGLQTVVIATQYLVRVDEHSPVRTTVGLLCGRQCERVSHWTFMVEFRLYQTRLN
jgi:hypothetical protein